MTYRHSWKSVVKERIGDLLVDLPKDEQEKYTSELIHELIGTYSKYIHSLKVKLQQEADEFPQLNHETVCTHPKR